MKLHSDKDLLKASRILANKVIDYSNKFKYGAEKVEMCLALDDLAGLARLLTPDLSDYTPEDDQSFM